MDQKVFNTMLNTREVRHSAGSIRNTPPAECDVEMLQIASRQTQATSWTERTQMNVDEDGVLRSYGWR
jgi:hypothetical protein